MTDPQTEARAVAHWYLASMNDGLFIIDTPPRPSTDDVWHDRPDGPSVVMNVTDLSRAKAQAIVDAHNTTLAARDEELEKVKRERHFLRDHVRGLIPEGQEPAQADSEFGIIGCIEHFRHRAERAEADLAKAREALEPFANFADEIDTGPEGYPWRDGQHILKGLSIAHFRAARRAAVTSEDKKDV